MNGHLEEASPTLTFSACLMAARPGSDMGVGQTASQPSYLPSPTKRCGATYYCQAGSVVGDR